MTGLGGGTYLPITAQSADNARLPLADQRKRAITQI